MRLSIGNNKTKICLFQPCPESVPHKVAVQNRKVLLSSAESREGLAKQVGIIYVPAHLTATKCMLNCFLASSNFCTLLIMFTNSLNPEISIKLLCLYQVQHINSLKVLHQIKAQQFYTNLPILTSPFTHLALAKFEM